MMCQKFEKTLPNGILTGLLWKFTCALVLMYSLIRSISWVNIIVLAFEKWWKQSSWTPLWERINNTKYGPPQKIRNMYTAWTSGNIIKKVSVNCMCGMNSPSPTAISNVNNSTNTHYHKHTHTRCLLGQHTLECKCTRLPLVRTYALAPVQSFSASKWEKRRYKEIDRKKKKQARMEKVGGREKERMTSRLIERKRPLHRGQALWSSVRASRAGVKFFISFNKTLHIKTTRGNK